MEATLNSGRAAAAAAAQDRTEPAGVTLAAMATLNDIATGLVSSAHVVHEMIGAGEGSTDLLCLLAGQLEVLGWKADRIVQMLGSTTAWTVYGDADSWLLTPTALQALASKAA
ncbi:MAG: hypothetical protein QM702_25230 [Rubrivivax sp.]